MGYMDSKEPPGGVMPRAVLHSYGIAGDSIANEKQKLSISGLSGLLYFPKLSDTFVIVRIPKNRGIVIDPARCTFDFDRIFEETIPDHELIGQSCVFACTAVFVQPCWNRDKQYQQYDQTSQKKKRLFFHKALPVSKKRRPLKPRKPDEPDPPKLAHRTDDGSAGGPEFARESTSALPPLPQWSCRMPPARPALS